MLARDGTRRIDFAKFMVAASTIDARVHEAPAIVICLGPTASSARI